MAKVDVTRTELVWPGKYNEDGTLKEVPRVSLPFQVIETVNESRATREARKTTGMPVFDEWQGTEGDSFKDGWRNKLIWGDNLLVMSSLLKRLAGKIDLIYIDPPFATGADFSFSALIGESGQSVEKQASAIEEKAYRDTWGSGISSWVQMLYSRLTIMRDLLSSTGSIYVHVDPRTDTFARGVLDGVFGRECFRNVIVWKRDVAGKGGKRTSRQWPRNVDTLLWYSRSPNTWTFEQQYVGLRPEQKKPYRYRNTDGRLYKAVQLGNYTVKSIETMEQKGLIHISSTGKKYKKYFLDEARSTIDCLWNDIHGFGTSTASREIVGYPTQKPEALLRRILMASSKPGELVADFFCGSGTTLAVAEKLGRRWIGCDLGRWGIHVTRKRMLTIERCKPFELLNLGKYERQYWSQSAFGDRQREEQAYFEYLAFVLKLYSARPVPGMTHLHGRKGKAMVHVGAVDAPVTISEIQSSIDECLQINQRELRVLGWEWEMGIQNHMGDEAKKQGVSLRLLQIPREVMEQQATNKGDVTFFELAYVEVSVERLTDRSRRHVRICLSDFVVPQPDLIPEEVRDKVSKWSDYIDYWAVDWDFREDTFMQGWVAYRTRKDRSLPLTSDSHQYDAPGLYQVVVKVIDIFGNDTSQVVDVEIR